MGSALGLLALSLASCGGGDDPAPADPEPGVDAAPPEGGGGALTDAGADAEAADASDAAADAGDGYLDPTGKSGTRLRRRYLVGGAGAYRTLDFWDTKLGLACEFAMTSDSSHRCLPRGRLDVVYADDNCTDPVLITTAATCAGLEYGVDAQNRAFRKTTERALTEYYYSSGGSCTPYPRRADQRLWTAEPALAAFVGGTTEEEPRASGLAARFVLGEDGSKALVSVHDTTRNAPCGLDREDGRCVPSRRASMGTFFADASCATSPVGGASAGVKPDLFYTLRRDVENGCILGTDYFAVGAPLAPEAPLFWRNANDLCLERTRRAGDAYYAVGAPVSVSSFPATKTAFEGTARVRAVRRVDVEDAPLGRSHAFWDSTRETACSPTRFPDGSYRCVPSASGTMSGFADATCSARLGRYSACVTSANPYLVDYGPRECAFDEILPVNAVYERGQAYAGASYYADVSCAEVPVSSSLNYFHPGPTTPADAFPELQLKTE